MPNSNFPPVTPSSYVSPLQAAEFTFVSTTKIYPYRASEPYWSYYYQEVQFNGVSIWTNEYVVPALGAGIPIGRDTGYTANLSSGVYTVIYEFWDYANGEKQEKLNGCRYTFQVVENHLPLKRWTCTDVINRLLDIAEPIRRGEKPRFRLQGVNDNGTYTAGSQAALFDAILAPEFAFTKQTLRECLQQVGEVLHGEPRLTPKKDSKGTWYFEVSYDLYGKGVKWKQAHRSYIKKSVTQNINTYSTSLDTHAENLVNRNGTITEPYMGGGKSVRTEQMYAQITESNMLIPTQFPIYTVQKLEYLQPQGSGFKAWDITPWLFESTIYSSQLSSYDQEYPYSKAYAVMFTQGEKNITQLNFKLDNAISDIFENYAIVNILRRVIGSKDIGITDYPQMIFRVTYTPIYQSRVAQTKINYKDYPTKAAMIYNQQSNVMDSKAYGENLKGVIARLGNAEKSYTYHLSRLSQIPTPGMMFDDDYTISGVYVEILSTLINCTVALTKNFNRISRYVGISSVKRYSQISQTMAVERNIIWNEYIVIGDKETPDLTTTIGGRFMSALADTFLQTGSYSPLTYVAAYGITGENNTLPAVGLPVIASAFGNSVSFAWEYEDNYSAGAISQYRTSGSGSNQVKGYFQNSYQYTDYYGKLYYYHFDLDDAGPVTTDDVANALPGLSSTPTANHGYISTLLSYQTDKLPYIVRKDNREKLQCNFQVDFVTNRKNFIIGSALARNFSLIRGTDKKLRAMLYVFPEPLNKFTDQIDADVDLSALQYVDIVIGYAASWNGFFTIRTALPVEEGDPLNVFPGSGKAWAIVTQRTTESTQVETETGQITTQTTVKGGEVLIGQNMEVQSMAPFPTVYFTRKRKIFKEDVWTDIR